MAAKKAWWKSRTIRINVLIGVLAAAESQLHLIQPLLPVNFYGLLAFGLVLLNTALRIVTSQAVGRRDAP
ncbi:MAG: hypothetical protein D3M94_07220 [Rhodocyclales bacterium GT-UBC]|nr:MAG: hypothetical protein D3M94_07220 [Rhodocyclales bacterium GT-UBC]